MENYSLEKILTLSDDDTVYVKKDAIYAQILYYEKHHPEYLAQISYLTEFVFKFMDATKGCIRIEMTVKDVKENFIGIKNLPIDSFVKYLF